MEKIDLIVTRHPGLVEYLRELGLCQEGVEVISHASPEAVAGRHVCGVLPHSLSCLTASFTEVPLALPAELRGVELTLEQVRLYASAPVTYRVEVVPQPPELRPDKAFLAGIARREYDAHTDWERPLIDVASSHDHVLSPAECGAAGVTLDTPCRRLTGGYNGKRPIYLLEGTLGLVVAEGTHMGNHSSFSLGKPGELRRVPRTVSEETRLTFLEEEVPHE